MPHRLSIASPLPNGTQGLELPDRINYPAGSTVTLDDVTFNAINPRVFTDGYATDLGVVNVSGFQVTTQGPAVTLTSSQISTTGSGTELTDFTTLATAINKCQTDIAALNTALSGAGKPLV